MLTPPQVEQLLRYQRERRNGRAVFYGDARQPDVLRSMGAADASLVIVTVDEFRANEAVVEMLRASFPGLEILVRGHDMEHCVRLSERGASFTVSENLEASIALAQEALVKAGDGREEIDAAIDRFRRNYYDSGSRITRRDPAGTADEP